MLVEFPVAFLARSLQRAGRIVLSKLERIEPQVPG
jgi:hypothetical protein